MLCMLSMRDYTLHCHGVIQTVAEVLQLVPKQRKPDQLVLLVELFSATSVLQRMKSHSFVFKRNCCRLMGLQNFKAGQRLYRRGMVGDRVFIVLSGTVNVDDEARTRGGKALRSSLCRFVYYSRVQ